MLNVPNGDSKLGTLIDNDESPSKQRGNALKCKPSAHYACAVLLIDGRLGAVTRDLPLVARGEADTG